MCQIAKGGTKRIYNIARGYNISNREIVFRIRGLTGCAVTSADDAPILVWPLIDNHRIKQEFDFKPVHLMDKLEDLINKYKEFCPGAPRFHFDWLLIKSLLRNEENSVQELPGFISIGFLLNPYEEM